MGVIFDLDQTLIDTSIADRHRKTGQWHQVYGLIPKFTLYPGVLESITYLHQQQIPMCVVTSSPSTYCSKVLLHWQIPIVHKICFHDTTHRKPHPEPIHKALALLGSQPARTLSFGDRDIDIQASNSANVISVACLWGTIDHHALTQAQPGYILTAPSDILPFLRQYFMQ